MRIRALTIGHVVLEQSFLHFRLGIRRRLELLLLGPWSEPMPIRARPIENGDERILADMGEDRGGQGRAVRAPGCHA
jgi:hypothetical protein